MAAAATTITRNPKPLESGVIWSRKGRSAAVVAAVPRTAVAYPPTRRIGPLAVSMPSRDGVCSRVAGFPGSVTRGGVVTAIASFESARSQKPRGVVSTAAEQP